MRKELLRMEDVCKAYLDVRVLKGVGFNLFGGEILAILGENGAGKSTLMKLLCGMEPMDSGRIYVQEHPVRINSSRDAVAHHIYSILQEPLLVPNFTVLENIFLYFSSGRCKNKRELAEAQRRTLTVLEKLSFDVDLRTKAQHLTLSKKVLLEIAMIVSSDSVILVLDETTASLNTNDVQAAKRVIREFSERGNGVIWISHNIDEVLDIADRIVVLREGMAVGNIARQDYDKERIIRLIIGREAVQRELHKSQTIGQTVLKLENVSAGCLQQVSLELHEGEILGITGLLGSGKSQIADVIFGLLPAAKGTLHLYGAPQSSYDPTEAVKRGIAYIHEDKNAYGIFKSMSIEDNLAITVLPKLGWGGVIKKRVKRYMANDSVRQLHITPDNVKLRMASLSDGNQQKVMLARCLAAAPKIVITDDVTMGLDATGKQTVFQLLIDLAAKGGAVLYICSMLPDLLQICDRVLVLAEGRIRGELSRDEITKEAIIALEMN